MIHLAHILALASTISVPFFEELLEIAPEELVEAIAAAEPIINQPSATYQVFIYAPSNSGWIYPPTGKVMPWPPPEDPVEELRLLVDEAHRRLTAIEGREVIDQAQWASLHAKIQEKNLTILHQSQRISLLEALRNDTNARLEELEDRIEKFSFRLTAVEAALRCDGHGPPPDPEPMPGDANGDGVVNIADLGVLAANWQQPVDGGHAQADFNGDGVVNIADLAILAANWGGYMPDGVYQPLEEAMAEVFDAPRPNFDGPHAEDDTLDREPADDE
jgi:hypothetical protein